MLTQTLDSGREAYQRNAWEEAFRELSAADAESALGPADLERLADAAWWSGRVQEAVDTLERAYLGYLNGGDKTGAAVMAIRLGERALRATEVPVAQGWMARAERLLEAEPESAAHAWYEFMRAAEALIGHKDAEQALAHADRAIDLGRAHGDADVENIARSFKGAALTKLGKVEEGLALIDEAATAATSGELAAKTACDVYCFTISACRDVSDLRRSTEWTERAERFMQRNAVAGYPGACKVHRAELKRLQGRWVEAEAEARSACEELERFRLVDVLGAAYYEIGQVRFRLGDLTGAEEAFVKAYGYGTDPQPGLALLQLTRGDVEEADRSLERSLGRQAGDDLVTRVQLLPARVEVSVAIGDLDGARAATEELERIAAEHANSIWTAAAATARGALDLAEENPAGAIEHLDSAWRQWQQLDFPYDSARARSGLGLARRASGDESGARLELNAALAVFERLGAVRDVQTVQGLLAGDEGEKPRATVTTTFMFTDIVTSTDLIGLIGDSAWADLLEWHDRTLRAAFAAGGEVVNHTGDGFLVVFDDPVRAIECAIEIQRRLRAHRSEHGFAPSIRIGIHTAEATKGETTYTGRGVHVAARVGGLGEAGEIVVSAETLGSAAEIGHPLSEPRTVTLKGVAEPVTVRTVDWG